jgi:PAS domain S-box-containing protein
LNTGKPTADLSQCVLEVLHNDDEFVLYRAKNEPGSPSVLLRTAASTQPAPETLKKMEHEYSLKNELDSAWAIRPEAISEQRGQAVLVLEDPGGETLDQFLVEPMELTQFLRFAIGLTTALGGLHNRQLIHKDVKPANVLVNPMTGQVRLTGFGIASRLPRERQSPDPPEFIAGTLPYMAPEQTGRMNRSIDSRSDLYALGVTLYQMVTGTLPFSASDAMESVHCHIAKKPTPPCVRLKTVPNQISAVIVKLLAKSAEERYQTTIGVERDLRRCLAEWEAQDRISEFRLGEEDIPDRLLIPEKLYGRESEIEALHAAFDRVVASGKPALVLVAGYSGIGKSAVVSELHKALVTPRGLFALGKFDQYKRDIPYSTLAQAFQDLIRRLLGKSESELLSWRNMLHEALDPNARLMTELIPELKRILGDPPPVPELEPQQAQRRFHAVFRRFINVFARPEHPLALFLDDLQWLDAATLDLIGDLMTRPDLQHLMLIGAYRDNEVDASHPLMRKLDAIRQAGTRVQEISLTPLTTPDLEQLIADTLHCEPEGVAHLATLVREKTAGNPFFVLQFLYSLAEEGLLRFDNASACWAWDLDRIHDKGYTDNVVDLMVGKLARLPTETKQALQQLACLGNIAATTMLATVLTTTEEQLHVALWPAVRQEFVVRLDGRYHFIHDRVQEAAYSLIPDGLRPEVHLRIGRLLAAQMPPEKWGEATFDVVNHLNRGAMLISQPEERYQLAEFNLIAGKRAKDSTAYASALTYLNAGSALLAQGCWEGRRELIFALELSQAECEFLTGQLPTAQERLAVLSNRPMGTVERAMVTCLKTDVCMTLDHSGDAVAACLDYLRHVGIQWSPHPKEEEVRREYERIGSLLGGRTIEGLIDLPLMDEPTSLATLNVLTKVLPAASITDANLASLAMCKAVSLSLEGGNCDASCVAYVMFGRIAGAYFGDYHFGYRFGQLGCDLIERRALKRFEALAYFCFAAFVVPWMKHVRGCRDLQRRAFEAANRIGDLTVAAYTCNQLNSCLLFAGEPLPVVQGEVEHGLAFAEKARFGLVIDFIATQQALIRTLRGLTLKFGCFDDGQFNERRIEQHLSNTPALAIASCWYWIRKLQARYIAGDYPAAMAAASKAELLLWTSSSFLEEAEYHYYGALARASHCDSAHDCGRQHHTEAIAAHHKLLQLWAENCPENFEHRAALVGAELARIECRDLDAMRLYERAIRSAQANGFVHNEALAHELASRFYAARGLEKIARMYLEDARHCYLRWGADGKFRQLDGMYPQFRQERTAPVLQSVISTAVEQLDLATVIKVSQSVSSEMVFERLIEKLLRTAIEHAGAERGLLILPQADELRIEAEATTSGDEVTVHPREAAQTALRMPESLVRYVARMHETVILEDASSHNPFAADPYIASSGARSILCLPLINQSKLIGLLYLENNLTPDVFTAGRVTALKVLASQAAISIENSRLYRDLEDRERKIRRLVDANILGIFIWNLQGEIVTANEAFLRMVQYGCENLVSGRVRWTDLTPLEWRERDEQALTELKAVGIAQPYEKEYLRKDGDRVPVLIGAALLEEAGNEGVAFVLDLREQKRAEAEIRALKDHLSRSSQLATMGELTASIAHEVNQPLAAVVANAEAGLQWLNRNKPNLEGARTALQRIARDGSDAGEIVKRLRALFRRAAPTTTECKVGELVAEVLKLLEHETIRRRVSVEVTLEEGLPTISCDRLQIQQVILNLMMNAMDAVDAAPPREKTVRVFANWDGSESLLLGVRDFGIGVQDPTRLFETFFTTKEKGLGMGLAISRSIIEAHGGHLWLDPTDGPGSTFCFRLRAKRLPGQI